MIKSRCKVCYGIYDRERAFRLFGESFNINGCCSPQCYTKHLLSKNDAEWNPKAGFEKEWEEWMNDNNAYDVAEKLIAVAKHFYNLGADYGMRNGYLKSGI